MFKSGQAYIAWRKFKKNKVAIIGTIMVLILILMGVLAPFVAPYNPRRADWVDTSRKFSPPSSKYLLGTDNLGRDVFSYVVWGSRSSILIALGIIIIETIIALVIGSISGYYGGIIDNILMRISEVLLTIPSLILLIVAVSMFKVRSSSTIMVLTGLLWWPWSYRILRSEFLSLKESLYVEAAKSLGASDLRIIFRHILPNALSPIIVSATFDLAAAILYLTTLTFLGLGDPTVVSWGNMINDGRYYLRTAWWIATFPGIAIFFTALGFNLIGDGLRDAFDIKSRI